MERLATKEWTWEISALICAACYLLANGAEQANTLGKVRATLNKPSIFGFPSTRSLRIGIIVFRFAQKRRLDTVANATAMAAVTGCHVLCFDSAEAYIGGFIPSFSTITRIAV